MAYLQWKQRLYAFLLRRILGPYLTETSLQKLHESIDVSFQEGTFTLKEIDLNASFLTSIIYEKLPGSSINLDSVRIRKLQVNLSLQENSKRDSSSNSSVAWKAMQLGGESGVSLIAHIEIDGMELTIQPFTEMPGSPSSPIPNVPKPSQESSSNGVISSYIDAALTSLRLSAKINDLQIRINSVATEVGQKWIQIGLASSHYYDLELDKKSQDRPSTSRTALYKAVDFSGIKIQTGEIQYHEGEKIELSSVIAKTDGVGQITCRAIEYDETSAQDPDASVRVENHIEANINQRFNISMEECSIYRILTVVSDLQRTLYNGPIQPTSSITCEKIRPAETINNRFDDIEDIHTVEGILKQYEQAKQRAARNEVRGGMLLPNSDNGTLTFDAFFDANDKSIANFASILNESMMETSKRDRVHTQFKFHLRELVLKLSFQDMSPSPLVRPGPAEYLLCSLADFNLSSSFSSHACSISASLNHALIDASQNVGQIADIGTILKFAEEYDQGGVNDHTFVSVAPCMEFSFERDSSVSTNSFELRLQGAEVFIEPKLVSNLHEISSRLHKESCKHVLNSTERLRSQEKSDIKNDLKLSIISPCISIYWPVSPPGLENNGEQEKHIESLFHRCGYDLLQEPIVDRTYLVLSLEDLALSTLDQFLTVESKCEGHLISCQRALFFVSAPRKDSASRICSMQRIDLLASSGHVPISICHKQNGPAAIQSVGRCAFPIVKPISTFKARQEDDDDQNSTPFMVGTCFTDAPLHKPTDSQPAFLKEVDKCESILELRVPDLNIDLTTSELVAMLQIATDNLSSFSKDTEHAPGDQAGDSISIQNQEGTSWGLLIAVEQITLCCHNTTDSFDGQDDSQMENFSFSVVGESWNYFNVFGTGTNCTRVLAKRVDLYEADGLLPARQESVEPLLCPGVLSCCDRIVQRLRRNNHTKARPVLYRTSLFSLLSPESPVLLVDVMNSQNREKSVYVSLYAISYRHDIESKWVDRLSKLVTLGDFDKNRAEPNTATIPTSATESLTRVFVTLADCIVDYTPPLQFDHHSRTIVRISEVRFSSNIVSPAPSVQAYRVAVGDISLLLCNRRYPYNSENKSLSRSAYFLAEGELAVKRFKGSIEQDMNLITMFTIDSVNALLTRTAQAEEPTDPLITANVAFGTVCLYGCIDSVDCLMNTVTEWNLYTTGLSDEAILDMKQKAPHRTATTTEDTDTKEPSEHFFDSLEGEVGDEGDRNARASGKGEAIIPRVNLHAQTGRKSNDLHQGFNLDGYDWTTVDHGWSLQGAKPIELHVGEEQTAKWYSSDTRDFCHDSNDDVVLGSPLKGGQSLRIIPHHVQLDESSDPLSQGDMDAATHAGTPHAPPVAVRVLVRCLTFRCRFFDGYDWPNRVERRAGVPSKRHAFIIEETLDHGTKKVNVDVDEKAPNLKLGAKKSQLMGALLDDVQDDNDSKTFEGVPLPEERAIKIRSYTEERRLARRLNRFLQISLSGVRVRVDTFSESMNHRLASCLDLKVSDFFIAETISDPKPVKLLGEWFNEAEHPRDSHDGLAMLKIVTWKPVERITTDNDIACDECKAVLHILPLRCFVDQRALRFARAFFASGEEKPALKWATHLKELPPPRFTWFRVKACKMKVDYTPEKVDVAGLRDGAIIELINLTPINDMVIVLQAVEVKDKVGFGSVVGELASSWVKDICSTQLYKFITSASPFQPISSIGGGAADMVILPWEAIRNGDSLSRAIRSGVSSFGGTVAFEALNTTARLTNYAAQKLQKSMPALFPSRPPDTPKSVRETTTHAIESLARGLDHANYKIVVVPYKAFQDKGAASAARAVVQGIPIAVLAPLASVNEAVSYTLLGARNTLRPDIRKEDEATQRGLRYDF